MATTSKVTQDHLHKKIVKKALSETIWVAGDQELVTRHDQARNRYANATRARKLRGEVPAIEVELEAARSELEQIEEELNQSGAVRLTFRAIGRKAFEELLSANPPSKDQLEDLSMRGSNGETPTFNPEVFPQRLVAASLGMADEEIMEWWDGPDWNGGELQELFFHAMKVNQETRIINLGNA